MNIKIGTVIGNWLVISDKFKEGKVYKNTCKCICGTIKNITTWHLNNNKTKGCGCTNIKGRFKAQCVGDLSKSYFNSFKSNRIKKNIEFDDSVNMEYLWELFKKQNKKCALSGIDITLNPRWSSQYNRDKKDIQTASIDRIDNNRGYFIDNVQWVHKDINYMKGSLDINVFKNYCNLISSTK